MAIATVILLASRLVCLLPNSADLIGSSNVPLVKSALLDATLSRQHLMNCRGYWHRYITTFTGTADPIPMIQNQLFSDDAIGHYLETDRLFLLSQDRHDLSM
jgi:hypothetical protein